MLTTISSIRNNYRMKFNEQIQTLIAAQRRSQIDRLATAAHDPLLSEPSGPVAQNDQNPVPNKFCLQKFQFTTSGRAPPEFRPLARVQYQPKTLLADANSDAKHNACEEGQRVRPGLCWYDWVGSQPDAPNYKKRAQGSMAQVVIRPWRSEHQRAHETDRVFCRAN
jgi:hypothetical protein